MKTHFNSLLTFLVLFSILFSTTCKDNTLLEVSTTSITINAENGIASITISCIGDWTIVCKDDWCTVVTSGSGSQIVDVKAAIYTGVENRQTSLTISNGKETKTITVTQLGLGLSFDSQIINFPAEGGVKILKLFTTDYTWSINPLSEPTFSISPMNGTGSKDLVITLPENTTGHVKMQTVAVNFNNKTQQFTIRQANWIKPENLIPLFEITSCDTTFSKVNECINVTINWKKPFSNEAALVKVSPDEQKNLLLKAKADNNNTDIALYLSEVQVWAGATSEFASIVYKGSQTDFREVSRGEGIMQTVTGNVWPRIKLKLTHPCEITGDEDIYIGAYASNGLAENYPFVLLSNNIKFPGRKAIYPSYGVCPDVEKYLQELNDPKDSRWNTWVKNSNWAMKLVFSTENSHK